MKLLVENVTFFYGITNLLFNNIVQKQFGKTCFFALRNIVNNSTTIYKTKRGVGTLNKNWCFHPSSILEVRPQEYFCAYLLS